MKMLVLGAGLQGCATAFDLLQNPAVTQVTIADLHPERLAPFLAPYQGTPRLQAVKLDVKDLPAVTALMRGHVSVMSAIPYYFNTAMATCAVEAGCNFSDLGGNTEIVFEQKKLHAAAAGQGAVGHSRLRPRAGHGEHPRRRGHPPARQGGKGQDLRRRAPEAPRAAAQLPDRVFPRGRARLLHHDLVDPPRRQAHAGGRAQRARAGGVSGAGRHARGVPHRRRRQHHALLLRGQGRRPGVQDAPLSRATWPSCGRSASSACSSNDADRREGPAGRAAGRCSSPRPRRSSSSRRRRTSWRSASRPAAPRAASRRRWPGSWWTTRTRRATSAP